MDIIEEYKNKILHLQEAEMGDFRRRSALYLNRLSENFQGEPEKQKKIEDMLNLTLNEYYENIEDLRDLLLEKIQDF